jgi:plasmid stabilization system protein ParE
MALRYNLVHHPEASRDYSEALDYFTEVDEGLAEVFKEDFRAALRGLASGRSATTLYAEGFPIRWVKLRRFSHKVCFEPEGDDVRLVLAVVSGRRHPKRIARALGQRRKRA